MSQPSSPSFDPLSLETNALLSSNLKLLESGEFSDLTIVCGSQQFQVHQFILCPRSKFFQSACQGNFLEGHTKRIELPDDDPTTVYRMLEYLYTLQYNIQEPSSESNIYSLGNSTQWKSCLHGHCEVYILAEKFDIKDLKQYSLGRFKVTVNKSEFWRLEAFLGVTKSTLSSLPTTDQGLIPQLLQLCANHIQKYPETLGSRYRKCDLESRNGKVIILKLYKSAHDEWQDVLTTNPEFTVALLRKVVQLMGT